MELEDFFTMNYFLGCDVAKSKLDICLINEQGIEQWIGKVVVSTSSV